MRGRRHRSDCIADTPVVKNVQTWRMDRVSRQDLITSQSVVSISEVEVRLRREVRGTPEARNPHQHPRAEQVQRQLPPRRVGDVVALHGSPSVFA
jgi:hypothetical protein